jgi:hypothetical protein
MTRLAWLFSGDPRANPGTGTKDCETNTLRQATRRDSDHSAAKAQTVRIRKGRGMTMPAKTPAMTDEIIAKVDALAKGKLHRLHEALTGERPQRDSSR